MARTLEYKVKDKDARYDDTFVAHISFDHVIHKCLHKYTPKKGTKTFPFSFPSSIPYERKEKNPFYLYMDNITKLRMSYQNVCILYFFMQ